MMILRRKYPAEDQLSLACQEVNHRWFLTLDVVELGQMESHTT